MLIYERLAKRYNNWQGISSEMEKKFDIDIEQDNEWIDKMARKIFAKNETLLVKNGWHWLPRFEEYENDMQVVAYMALKYICAKKYDISPEMLSVITRKNSMKKNLPFVFEEYFALVKNGDRTERIKRTKTKRWCEEYKNVFLMQERNLNIFDVKELKTGLDISRYSYWQTRKIYEQLKDTDIENIFLLEFTLGSALVNTLYAFLSECSEFYILENFLQIVREVSKIECVFLREKFAREILERFLYLKEKEFTNDDKELIGILASELKFIIPKINLFFYNLLECELYLFLKENMEKLKEFDIRTEYLEEQKREVKTMWYYSDEKAYKDLLTLLKETDWKKDEGLLNEALNIDEMRKNHSFLLGEIVNSQQDAVRGLSEEEKRVVIRKAVKRKIAELRAETEEKVNKYDGEMKVPKEKLEPMKVYAIIQHTVISEYVRENCQ